MKRTRALLALVAVVAAVPLSVSVSPPRVTLAPALACSGTAYVETSPRSAWQAPVDAVLPANGKVFVYQDRKQPYSWAPKPTDVYTFREASVGGDGRAVSVSTVTVLPGLLALTPSVPLSPGKRYALAWTDEGNVKPLVTTRIRPEEDRTAPSFQDVGKFRGEPAISSSCGTLGPTIRIPLRIVDESPVVLALWHGQTDEGAPTSFARYDATATDVEFVVERLDAQPVTLVAIDAALHRSAPRVVFANLDAPSAASGAVTSATRRGCGCGKF